MLKISVTIATHVPKVIEQLSFVIISICFLDERPKRISDDSQSCRKDYWTILEALVFLTRYHHILSYHMISYQMVSYIMIWYHIIWYQIIWNNTIWYSAIWYHTISYQMIWYYIRSYDIVSYCNDTIWLHIIEYHMGLYRIKWSDTISHHMIWYHMISCVLIAAADAAAEKSETKVERKHVFMNFGFENQIKNANTVHIKMTHVMIVGNLYDFCTCFVHLSLTWQ